MTELVVSSDTENESSSDLEPSFHAVAVNATEMKEANTQIKSFLEAKMIEISAELAEMQDAYEVAKTRKWATKALYNQVRSITRRKIYYEKLLAAVHAGYTIVPNMPVDVFVIRTNRAPQESSQQWTTTYRAPGLNEEKEQRLEIGDGRNTSPRQAQYDLVGVDITQADGTKVKGSKTKALGRFEDVEFPLAAAHPVVMAATDEAMKMKIFDRIGIVPQGIMKKRVDPIILGQIIRKEGYTEKITSFLIAWHLDMRTL